MNYGNSRLKQMLAAEYVLGTLRGLPRQRFARLLKTRADLQAEVRFWEARLAPLLGQLPPKAPRELVWAAIDRQINAQPPQAQARLKRGANAFLQLWAVAASVAVVALSLQLYRIGQQPPPAAPQVAQAEPVEHKPPFVAMLQDPKSETVWLVSLNPQRGRISVITRGQYALDKTHSLELWMLGEAGKPPTPLGLLPATGKGSMPMPAGIRMPDKPMLAVSLEPAGGSPTGLPTGPVLLSGPVVAL
ncbi:Anti-sigma-K factor RskA [Solimonas aquatica]|uniref:Anti-sigma-K factor RskA n=1 Tax=Solimonas aquatica TaxID=489703 RepID=A0A1H9F7F5_9GAMM|nr:anti-sigma factor [Solimonas aquatica]SEQ33208.1 Anti-sigma-K factor RskA [Solimonas aquatica]